MMARHLSLGRTFGIFVPLSNPHFAAVDDPLAIYEFLVWHGFRLQLPGGDQIRSFFCTGPNKVVGFIFWSCVFCLQKLDICILFFYYIRGGLDDCLLNSDRTLEKKWSNLRLERIGGGSTDHLFIYDLSLENYKVGVFNSWRKYLLFRKRCYCTLLEGVTFARMRIVLLSSGLMWIEKSISFQWWRASRSHSHSDDGGDDDDAVVVVVVVDMRILYIISKYLQSIPSVFHGSVLGEWEINSGTWLTCMNSSDVLIYRWFQFPIANLFGPPFWQKEMTCMTDQSKSKAFYTP